ncbi:NAD(P)-dependent oxidoreductase [Acuticoccus sediminis]|uniref:NAD(P)-dependent oxidoreductase n=1 Tax=Acuticoccus sediminis TaxID=2184697 RepID=A0A8B2NKA5_9HYPH|nr:NAD(P)-dependent oxidoreductase [Acuticoccus sediminis]RAH98324.1 NAD(P)-dependent oxidoreductase [Acuticoccus sediminis]
MDVGIIGVGMMGHGIARNVMMRGKFKLSFLDHPGNQPVDELLSLGATRCATPRDVAAASDVIILCVTGSAQVEAVLTGPDGVLAALRPGAIVVDCSTSLPQSTLAMAGRVTEAGGAFIDAPMTRTVQHAHDGVLNLLVGGDAAVLAKVKPVLESFTERVDHVGDLSAGHRMKLLHNFVAVGFMSLLAEAAAQSADAGIDPQVFVDVLAHGGGGGTALDRLSPFITRGDASGIPFAISNGFKDIGYYRTMAEQAGAQHTIADGVLAALDAVVADGKGASHLPLLVELFRRTSVTA